MDVDGLITLPSSRPAKDTIDRLAATLKEKGVTVFARIDHAANAAAVGMALRPTDLLIFGNAKAGTPLMQLGQTIGIDLPLKALAWEDAQGKAWLAYNDPLWLAHRHRLGRESEAAAGAMATLLAGLAKGATS